MFEERHDDLNAVYIATRRNICNSGKYCQTIEGGSFQEMIEGLFVCSCGWWDLHDVIEASSSSTEQDSMGRIDCIPAKEVAQTAEMSSMLEATRTSSSVPSIPMTIVR